MAIGLPILGLAAWLLLRRARSSVWLRLVLCVLTTCVFMPVGIYIGGPPPLIVPAVVMIGFIFTGEREGFRMAFDAGILPITLAALLLLGTWSAVRFLRRRVRNDAVQHEDRR
jgi:hypothetical protein